MGHEILARVAPEFAINEADARTLAVKFCNVARHYSMFTDVDPKTRDIRLFLVALAMLELPRAYRATARRGREKQAAKAMAAAAAQAPGGTIIDLDNARR